MSTGERARVAKAYHQRTRHQLDRYASGPGSLDWDAQPDPFRTWQGTRRYDLPRDPPDLAIPWSALDAERAPAPFDLANLGRLLRLAVAITAWKQYGDARWALRAHPSSGNLHPTETWVIAYWVDGLADGLYHYQNRDHGIEWRASTLTGSDRPGLWLGFTSIAWREAWKYGERAFRYCQLDMGHVLAAVAYAAALFGWQPRLLSLSHAAMARCLGSDLAAALRREFEWVAADPELPLYRLVSAKAERTARTVSCHQDIARQSAFTMMFLAEFAAPIEEDAAAYRHLHWEAGMLGHCATLEAEAAGWRGTGIGCFFDDADHELLGLGDSRYQVIYHYAVGMALDDPRITTLPAYE